VANNVPNEASPDEHSLVFGRCFSNRWEEAVFLDGDFHSLTQVHQ